MKHHHPLRIVIKLGTSSIVHEKTHEPLLSTLTLIVETATKLQKDGHKVVIVSSGAIGVGLLRMNTEKRPKRMSQLQALAAIGQCRLMSLWDSLFNHLGQPIGQILLTRSDIADRSRYLNAKRTFSELLDMGVIPIVNENDTLTVSEIKFGDNDTLSAITAAMISADLLFLMTDVDCLYDKNPRSHPDAQPIEVVEDIGALVADVSTTGSSLGTGGMSTKIVAARLATSAGVTTVITRASTPGNIRKIVNFFRQSSVLRSRSPSPTRHRDDPAADEHARQQSLQPRGPPVPVVNPPPSRVATPASFDYGSQAVPLHTRFLPSQHPIHDRSFWILHGLKPHGTIYIDAGAHRALIKKAGLLPVGVVDVEGSFAQHEAVRICVVTRRKPEGSDSSTGTESISIPNLDLLPSLSSSATALPENSVQPSPSSANPTPSLLQSAIPVPVGGKKLWEGPAREVARALTSYSSSEIARIRGHKSSEIERLLGYADSEYVAPREYITLFGPDSPVGDESGVSAGRSPLQTPVVEKDPSLLSQQ